MRLGVSTACLYPMKTEEALKILIGEGFRCFEIFFNSFSELKKEYLKELARMIKENGCCVKSIHPFTSGFESTLLFSDYERRFEDGLDFYDYYYAAAEFLGAEILVLHGDKHIGCTGIGEKCYFDRYAKLSERGKRFGVTLAQENVNLHRSASAEFLYRMSEYLGERVHYVFDVKQAVRAGENPMTVCRTMGKQICHVHINDNLPSADCLLPGCGGMQFEKLFTLLKEFGYAGDFIIEVYRRNFSEPEELRTSCNYLRRILPLTE